MLAILTNELDPDTAREYLLNSDNRAASAEHSHEATIKEVTPEPEKAVTVSDHLVKEGVVIFASTVDLIHTLCFWC